MRLIHIVFFILFSIGLTAQSDKLLSIKQMKKDIAEMLAVVEAHPDPFTHIPEQEFMDAYTSEVASITQEMNILDYYKKVSKLVALIRDGHSSVRMPTGWMTKKRKQHGVFPLSFYLSTEDELFVIKNYGEVDIPLGAKITKINDLPVLDFLAAIDPYISYEKKSFRNTRIDGSLEFYLYLNFGQSDGTKLDYFSGSKKTVTVQNIEYAQWISTYKDNRQEREASIAKGEPYSYENIGNGTGLLKIHAFRARDIDDYDRFLLKTFKSIQEDSVHSLVVDVRGNFGGWPRISSKLFHYLTDTPFKTVAQRSTKVSKAYREYYYERYPNLRFTNYAYRSELHMRETDAVLRDKIGTYKTRDFEYNELPKTRKYEFDGDLYLLTNRDSYSAASSFAATFQCYQMGSIIGEETSGTKIFRASAIPKKLSRSALVVYMSTSKVLCACYNEEFEGVSPTIEYSPSINELVSDMDTHLLYTQRIIKMVQKKKKEDLEKEELQN